MEELYTKLVFPIVISAALLAGFVSMKRATSRDTYIISRAYLAQACPVVFVAFPISYARLARVLFHQGAAVAGWEESETSEGPAT